MTVTKIDNLNEKIRELKKQNLKEEMKAKDFTEGEEDRREKLQNIWASMGFPTTPNLEGKERRYAEVKEDKKVPWQVNESGIKK